MTKKILCALLLSAMMLGSTACAGGGDPEASIPPGITHPEGGVVSTNPMGIQGRVTKLKKDKMEVKVQGVTWKFELPEQIQKDIIRLAEFDIVIEEGTFVVVYYEENENGKRVVTRIERLEAN